MELHLSGMLSFFTPCYLFCYLSLRQGEESMARAPFTLFSRPSTKGRKVYYARFQDEEGRIIRTVSLGTGNKTEAARFASKLLADGVVSRDQNPLFLNFIDETWSKDSTYVQGRALRGVTISDRYVEDSRKIVHRIFGQAFKGLHVLDLTPAKLESAVLKASKSYGPRTVNQALQAVKVPYAWFCRQHRLTNPLISIRKLAEHTKERGTISAAELAAIIDIQDESPRIKVSVLLGGLCGLRLGEVRGLQWEDVDTKLMLIHICHNAPTNSDTVKEPKWGSTRSVPMPQAVADELKLVKAMTNTSPSFVVFNEAANDRPIEEVTIIRGFQRLLRKVGVSDQQRKDRNISFHSLRHTYVSLTRAAGVPDFAVMRLAGHRSGAMTETYSHVDNVVDFSAARAAIDSTINAAKVNRA
jgi:integrase